MTGLPGAAPVDRRSVEASTPVVLLKLSEDPLAHGAVGIARSLGRLGVPVHVLGVGDWRPLGRSRYVVGGADLPADLRDEDRLERVLAYGRQLGGRPILLCVGDVSALFVDAHGDELWAHYRFPRQPDGLATLLADKAELARLCESRRIPTPLSMVPSDMDDVRRFAEDVGFPMMVKSADPRKIEWRHGQVSAARVDDLDALLGRVTGPDGSPQPNLVLQQFVPGGSDSVWFFHGYFDDRSRCVAGFVGQKLREHPPGAGPTMLGVCRENAAVRDAAVDLLEAVCYSGLVDVEFRFDARTGRYLLLDLNPRIGANFRLFVTANGVDVARAFYLDMTGADVPPHVAPEGRKWWVESHDPATWRAYFGRGRMPWRQLLPSLRGVREAAWWAPDDPVPFLAMLRYRAGEAKRRVLEGSAGQHPLVERLEGRRRRLR